MICDIKDKKKIEWLLRTVRLYQEEIKLSHLCSSRGYTKLAIYGWNEISNCLLYDIESSGLSFMYLIERDEKNKGSGYPVYTLKECTKLNAPDAIIVCVTYEYDKIVNDLKRIFGCDVMSFEDLIYEI